MPTPQVTLVELVALCRRHGLSVKFNDPTLSQTEKERLLEDLIVELDLDPIMAENFKVLVLAFNKDTTTIANKKENPL
ncbi:hypothetical protein ACPV5O_26800 [Vibrio maritimus]|uniref:hypothetical protein n=1 Tax=Vibrio maritimus TaxID=990268 RepID=UPI004068FECF